MVLVPILNLQIPSIGIVIDIEISNTGIDQTIELYEYQKPHIAFSVKKLGGTWGIAAVEPQFLRGIAFPQC